MATITVGDTVTGSNNVTGVVADQASVAAALAVAAIGDTIQAIRNADVSGGSALTVNISNITITAHAGCAVNAPTYAAATSRARVVVSSGANETLYVQSTGCVVEKIGIGLVVDQDIGAFNWNESTTLRRCAVWHNSSTTGRAIDNRAGTGKTATISNCFVLGAYNGAILQLAANTMLLYHVSVLDRAAATGVAGVCAYGNANCIKALAVVVQSTGGDCFTSGAGGSFDAASNDNVSQNDSAPGSNTRKSISGVFKDTSAGNEDLNLNGLNGGLLQGVADYSGTVADVATDLNGNARPAAAGFPLDPGCAQIASGPSVMAYASSGAVSTSTSTTEVVSINVPSGTKTLVVCASGNDAISSADWNGTAMTAAAGDQNAGGVRTKVFTLESPATGTHNITVTYTSCNRRWIAAFAIAIAGDTNAPTLDVGDGATGSSVTSLSKSTTTAVANEGAFDILSSGQSGANPVANSPQVLREKCSSPSFFEASVSCRLAVSAASTSDGWTFDSSTNVALSVVYMKPGGGGGGSSGTITSMLSLMGVG